MNTEKLIPNYRIYDRTGGRVTCDIYAENLEEALETGREWIEDGDWSGLSSEDKDHGEIAVVTTHSLECCVRELIRDEEGEIDGFKNFLECPYDYFEEIMGETDENGETINEDIYFPNLSKFVENEGIIYVDNRSADKILPVGRAKKNGLTSAVYCGNCYASDLTITINSNGTIFETGMSIENAKSVIIAEYRCKADLIKAYPCSGYHGNPDRCANCQGFSKRWFNKNKSRLSANVSELLEDCRQLA